MISLRRLTEARRSALRLLYLAPHAPAPGAAPPAAIHPEFGVQPAYQYEVWDMLANGLGLDVESRCRIDELPEAFAGRNFVFTLFNIAPFRNSEVYVTALAAAAGIACLGAPANIRALAEDKWLTKLTAQALGVSTPAGMVINSKVPAQPPEFDGPYIAKPRFGAASMGIDTSSARPDFAEIASRSAELGASIDECLVEQVVGDCDVTVSILVGEEGPVALPPARQSVDSPFGIFTHLHKRKLIPGLVRDFPGDEPWLEPIVEDALRFARAVTPYDYLRCDFRYGAEGHALLECNVACSIGREMAFAQSAVMAGISFESLVEHVLVTSLDRQWGKGADGPPDS